MNDEQIRKYTPMALIGAAIIGGIYYLRRGAGTVSNNTGYSVVNPPDNSAGIAAAASIENARMQLAGTGLATLASLTSQKEKDATDLSLAHVSADAGLQLANIDSARQLGLSEIASENEIDLHHSQLTALQTQADFQLNATRSANDAALAIQKEQDAAALNFRSIDSATQDNAVRAAASVQKHHDNTSIIS